MPAVTNSSGLIGHTDLAVSGVACRLPRSANIDEFARNLREGIDMVDESDRNGERFEPGMYGTPKRYGKLHEGAVSGFDALFFGVNGRQASRLDPQVRLLLQTTYESIVDAGYCPDELRGKNIGVFVGASASEAHDYFTRDVDSIDGNEMTGCMYTMFANRISYTFDWHGPSQKVDTACSASLLALDEALMAIRLGRCDAAIVAGANLILNAASTLQFAKLGMVSQIGESRSFDKDACGYCRAEGVVSIFVQRSKDSKRIYFHPVAALSNCDGYKAEGITFPSAAMQKVLLKQLYHEAQVDPLEVTYVECHGTGTVKGDAQEGQSVTSFFCPPERHEALLIGSTKSNMGHPEPCSGLSSICKLLVTFQDRRIPPNLHFSSPNLQIEGLALNRLKVVCESTEFKEGFVGVNNFGFGGANTHLIINPQCQSPLAPQSTSPPTLLDPSHPTLFVHCARTESSVAKFLESATANQSNLEYLTLLHQSAEMDRQKNLCRGFTILNQLPTTSQAPTEIKQLDSLTHSPSIWFVYSGMGAQWSGMAQGLLQQNATFAQSIEQCHKILQEKVSFDLLATIAEAKFDNVVKVMVSNAAIQLALTDLLRIDFGVEAEYVFGHSTGETLCPYALKLQSLEESLLAVYWRAQVLLEAMQDGSLPRGDMIACLATYESMQGILSRFSLDSTHAYRHSICVAAHNAPGSLTMSGESGAMQEFKQYLVEKEGVKIRDIDSSHVPFHTPLLQDLGKKLSEKLMKLIPNKRSIPPNWFSTSVPHQNSTTNSTHHQFDGNYHVQNFLSPVHFAEVASKYIGKNSVVFEIGPQPLLTSQIKKCVASSLKQGKGEGGEVHYVSLMNRGNDSQTCVLQGIGRAFNGGIRINVQKLLPPITLPITNQVPFISPLVDWDHSEKWPAISFAGKWSRGNTSGLSAMQEFVVDLDGEEWEFLEGHAIDNRVILPATAYIDFVWQSFASCLFEGDYHLLPVQLENVKFLGPTFLERGVATTLKVSILIKSGCFEVSNRDTILVSGVIKALSGDVFDKCLANLQKNHSISSDAPESEQDFPPLMDSSAIYTELKLRGYNYTGKFAKIVNQDLLNHLCTIPIERDDDKHLTKSSMIPFMDMMLQSQILDSNDRVLALPTRIRDIKICVNRFETSSDSGQPLSSYEECRHDPILDSIWSRGVILSGLHCTAKSGGKTDVATHTPTYQVQHFIPSHSATLPSIHQTLSLALDTLLNHHPTNHKHQILIVQQSDALNNKSRTMYNAIVSSINNILRQKPSHRITLKSEKNCTGQQMSRCDMIILYSSSTSNHQSALHNELHKVIESKPNLLILDFNRSSHDFLHSQISPRFTMIQSIDILMNLKSHESNTTYNHTCNFYYTSPTTSSTTDTVIFRIDDITSFNWVADLQRRIEELKRSHESSPDRHTILLLNYVPETSDAENRTITGYMGLVGFTKSLLKETQGQIGNISIRLLIGEFDSSKQSTHPILSGAFQILVDDPVLGIGTLQHFNTNLACKAESEYVYLDIRKRGDFSTLDWFQSRLDFLSNKQRYEQFATQSSANSLCKVAFASINFRDVMVASGRILPEALPLDVNRAETLLGLEFSGLLYEARDESEERYEKRIMGFMNYEGLATYVSVPKQCYWEVPDSWSLEEGATVPVAYLTAYYSLVIRGQIAKGQSVLIHSAAGAVGQASIRICQSRGLDVFVTVGTESKRDFLVREFAIDARHIFNSRSVDFEHELMRETRGRGVDLVLNSLAGEMLQASVRCVAKGGCFLEIGKFDLSQDSQLRMSFFLNNTTFHGILLDALQSQSEREWRRLCDLMSEGLRSGEVQPLVHRVFEHTSVQEAFTFMTRGTHLGKILIRLASDCGVSGVRFDAVPKFVVPEDGVCVVVGGLGAVGLEVCNWLVRNGCRNLVITSRSGVRSRLQEYMVYLWKRVRGCEVKVVVDDFTRVDEVRECFRHWIGNSGMRRGRRLFGVFLMSGVLEDRMFERMNGEAFARVFESKARQALNVDRVTREFYGADLAHFVCFSSVVGGYGNAGQTNYALANSYLDEIVSIRNSDGLSGVSIQWGAIGEVGMFAKLLEKFGRKATSGGGLEGLEAQSIASVLASLKSVMMNSRHLAMGNLGNIVSCRVLSDSKSFSSATNAAAGGESEKTDLLSLVASILGFSDHRKIPKSSSLSELGLYSFALIEVKNKIESITGSEFSADQVSQMTFANLEHIVANDHATQTTDTSSGNVSLEGGREGGSLGVMNSLSPIFKLQFERIKVFESHEWIGKEMLERLESDVDVQLHAATRTSFVLFGSIEGTVEKLRSIAQRLPLPVYGFNFNEDSCHESIEALTHQCLEILEQRIERGENLVILGYSYGCCSALQLVDLLTRSQYRGTLRFKNLVLIDGSHTYVRTLFDMYGTIINENLSNKLPVMVFCAFLLQFFNLDKMQLLQHFNQLSDSQSFEQQIYLIIRHFIANQSQIIDFETAHILFYRRMKMAMQFKPAFKLHPPILLFRSTQKLWKALVDAGDLLNLDEILETAHHASQDAVRLYQLDGCHNSIVEDPKHIDFIASKILEFIS